MDQDQSQDQGRQRILPACDTCHSRKVRCDRKPSCGNCDSAGISCSRTRVRQTGQDSSKQREQISEVLSRVQQLEESWRRSSASDNASNVAAVSTPDDESETTAISQTSSGWTPQPQQSRKRCRQFSATTSRPPQRPRPTRTASGSAAAPARLSLDAATRPFSPDMGSRDLQRYFGVQGASSGTASSVRQRVLDSAVQIARQHAFLDTWAKTYDPTQAQRTNLYETSMYPSMEFIYHAVRASASKGPTGYFFRGNSSVSGPELERMTCSLLDCSVHDQLRVRYLIIVNWAACSYLIALDREIQNSATRERMRCSRKQYCDNVLTAFACLNLHVAPELTLLQALEGAIMCLQAIGDMRRCWQLNTVACRLIVALEEQFPPSAEVQDMGADAISFSMIGLKCYLFDKALSANVCQPPAMLSFGLNRAILDPDREDHVVLGVLIEIAQVQETMIQETRRWSGISPSRTDEWNQISALRPRLRQIWDNLQECRTDKAPSTAAAQNQHQKQRGQPNEANDDFLALEWQCVEFVFHSTMMSVTRLSVGDGEEARQDCLMQARRCLSALKTLLRQAGPCPHLDLYSVSLSWVVPLFSLRPLYLVFSNIVSSLDSLDLKLIQDVTDALEEPAEGSMSIRSVHSLCKSLIEIYSEFAERALSAIGEGGDNPRDPQQLWQQQQGQRQGDQLSGSATKDCDPRNESQQQALEFDMNFLDANFPNVTFPELDFDWQLLWNMPQTDTIDPGFHMPHG